MLLLTGFLEQSLRIDSRSGFASCLCLLVEPITTILLSPFTLNSSGLEDYALTVQGSASDEVTLGSQLIPHGADHAAVPWQPVQHG